jgi:hypothetical protein
MMQTHTFYPHPPTPDVGRMADINQIVVLSAPDQHDQHVTNYTAFLEPGEVTVASGRFMQSVAGHGMVELAIASVRPNEVADGTADVRKQAAAAIIHLATGGLADGVELRVVEGRGSDRPLMQDFAQHALGIASIGMGAWQGNVDGVREAITRAYPEVFPPKVDDATAL